MNKEAFKQVLDIVERSVKSDDEKDHVFDYGTWFNAGDHKTVGEVIKHPCGTIGCLGGWGAILESAKVPDGLNLSSGSAAIYDIYTAARFYGINVSEADYLFYGDWHADSFDAPAVDVIEKLKNIIETGLVKNAEFDARYQ